MISISGAFNNEQVRLIELHGEESYSNLFCYRLVLSANRLPPQPNEIIGKKLNIHWTPGKNIQRFFNGIVSKFSYAKEKNRIVYYITLSPSLWLLNFRKNHRVFSEKYATPIEIIEQILKENGIDYEKKLSANYAKNDYCVQYGETDFAFVSRLLEQHGIFYFFKQQENNHILVLADNNQLYTPFRHKLSETARPDNQEQLFQWQVSYSFYSGRYSSTSHDFTQPNKQLSASNTAKPLISQHKQYEVFDYPGNYLTNSDGNKLAQLRQAQEQTESIMGMGESNYLELEICHKVEFADKPYIAEKDSYVITKIQHVLNNNVDETTEAIYKNTFSAVPATVVLRPTQVVPKPRAPSTQLAIVTGPAGQEIYTDKFGRLKVQFYWDREGTLDEKSSCWIRCMHHWEGVLRVGTPVLIGFIDADVDQPIILGPLHNGNLLPLYELEANKTKSGLKRRSINKTDEKTYNEISFDDKKDAQKLSVYASKDMEINTENNFSHAVKKGDYQLKVNGNISIEAAGSITLFGKKGVQIKSSSDLTLKGMTINNNADKQITSKAPMQNIESDGVLTLKGGLIKEN